MHNPCQLKSIEESAWRQTIQPNKWPRSIKETNTSRASARAAQPQDDAAPAAETAQNASAPRGRDSERVQESRLDEVAHGAGTTRERRRNELSRGRQAPARKTATAPPGNGAGGKCIDWAVLGGVESIQSTKFVEHDTKNVRTRSAWSRQCSSRHTRTYAAHARNNRRANTDTHTRSCTHTQAHRHAHTHTNAQPRTRSTNTLAHIHYPLPTRISTSLTPTMPK